MTWSLDDKLTVVFFMLKTEQFISRVSDRFSLFSSRFFFSKNLFLKLSWTWKRAAQVWRRFLLLFSAFENFSCWLRFLLSLSNMEAVGERLTCYACFQVSFIGWLTTHFLSSIFYSPYQNSVFERFLRKKSDFFSCVFLPTSKTEISDNSLARDFESLLTKWERLKI